MVFFVGAGPGGEELITLKGNRLLKEADLIIYAGSLVNPALLKVAREGCKILNSASMTLEEVTEELISADRSGMKSVRLHTGDPSIYGAIREQMDILDEAKVEYEVVPGVSSLNGVASALKAEYTLPGVSQTVIVTRMAGRTPVPEMEEISLLASHGATMAIFLSASMVDKLAEKLIEGGYREDTRAAIVYKATWPEEKVCRCTVGTLGKVAEENGVKKTAMIVVGDFLGDKYERSMLYDPAFSHEYREEKK